MIRAFSFALFVPVLVILMATPERSFASDISQFFCDREPYPETNNNWNYVICDTAWYMIPTQNAYFLIGNPHNQTTITNSGTRIRMQGGQVLLIQKYEHPELEVTIDDITFDGGELLDASSDSNRILMVGFYILLFGVGMFVGQQR